LQGESRRNRVLSPKHHGENEMAKIEQIELEKHHGAIVADIKNLVDRYRAIFDWDVPEIDQSFADKIIFVAIRKALDDIENKLMEKVGRSPGPI
jgi:hypothetical protein